MCRHDSSLQDCVTISEIKQESPGSEHAPPAFTVDQKMMVIRIIDFVGNSLRV